MELIENYLRFVQAVHLVLKLKPTVVIALAATRHCTVTGRPSAWAAGVNP